MATITQDRNTVLTQASGRAVPTFDEADFARWRELITLSDAPHEKIQVIAPFTGDFFSYVWAGQPTDVHLALQKARAVQPIWADTPIQERKAIMLRFHDLVLQHQERLLDLVQLETGKARQHAAEDVIEPPTTTRYYAYRAARFLKPRQAHSVLPIITRARVNHVPVGVVGIIAPWNYPFALAVSDATPALLAGNTVILKPSELTPFSALYALELLHEAGLPRDVMQIVTGYGPDLGPALMSGVDYVCFTGSTATGRIIAQQAAERLIGCSLELGGKNPMIVLADADLKRAARNAVLACFSNAGQLCISIERLYVQSGVYDAFVELFLQNVRRMKLNARFDFSADMGSLLSEAQLKKVQAHVADAVQKGATVLVGGKARPDLGPYFYEPTVLANVTPEMRVAQEETFGPVVSLYRFETVEEAIQLANDSSYGLNASIWTRNIKRGHQIARRIACGTVNINDGYRPMWITTDAPMGGMKQSGLGRRHGPEGLLKYTEAQTVAVQRFLTIEPPRGVSFTLFLKSMTWLVRIIRRVPFWR